jgi:hypothetical protein
VKGRVSAAAAIAGASRANKATYKRDRQPDFMKIGLTIKIVRFEALGCRLKKRRKNLEAAIRREV